MKILIISDGHASSIYDGAFARGFQELGHEVYRFTWKEYFKHYQYSTQYQTDGNKLKSIYYRAQNKLTFGPALFRINSDIVKKCVEISPNFVFIYRGTHVYPSTIKKIKEKVRCKVFGYNNDDPFSLSYPEYFWRHYKNGVKYYDHIFSYRYKNIDDYNKMGYKKVSLLRSYYLKNSNYFIEKLPTDKYKCDVVFIGHFENDGRDEAIKLLIENDINIKLYGTLWENSQYFEFFEETLGKITPLYEDYNIGLNSVKIALVFLSKKNNDTYTRRCFEIPITKTMMMSEYTDDLNSMFEQGKEAEYFTSKEELLEKVKFYLSNEEQLKQVGENGYRRLMKDGHEVVDRCQKILKIYNEE